MHIRRTALSLLLSLLIVAPWVAAPAFAEDPDTEALARFGFEIYDGHIAGSLDIVGIIDGRPGVAFRWYSCLSTDFAATGPGSWVGNISCEWGAASIPVQVFVPSQLRGDYNLVEFDGQFSLVANLTGYSEDDDGNLVVTGEYELICGIGPHALVSDTVGNNCTCS